MYLGVAGAGDGGDAVGVADFGVAGGTLEGPGVSVTVFA